MFAKRMVRLMCEGFGLEHRYCDSGQNLFIFLYLVAWAADSFLFHLSIFLMHSIPWFVRGSLTLIFVLLGVYLVRGAHEVVFEEASSDPQVIDWGVFSYVRHPMYLGILLILIGLFFWSFSLLALCIWGGFFFFYNRMATFEEKDLNRIFGDKYQDYQRRVGKWFPKLV
jgi:protein-S-isoprenylcysteine O-methyltransferase Ste14